MLLQFNQFFLELVNDIENKCEFELYEIPEIYLSQN